MHFIPSFLQKAEGGTHGLSPPPFYPHNDLRQRQYLSQVYAVKFLTEQGFEYKSTNSNTLIAIPPWLSSRPYDFNWIT